MTHSLRSGLWWAIPFRILLDQFWDTFGESLVVRLYSEIDHTYLSIEAQCVSHHYPRWTATYILYIYTSRSVFFLEMHFLVQNKLYSYHVHLTILPRDQIYQWCINFRQYQHVHEMTCISIDLTAHSLRKKLSQNDSIGVQVWKKCSSLNVGAISSLKGKCHLLSNLYQGIVLLPKNNPWKFEVVSMWDFQRLFLRSVACQRYQN